MMNEKQMRSNNVLFDDNAVLLLKGEKRIHHG